MWVQNKRLLIFLGYDPIVIAFGSGQQGLTEYKLNEEEAVIVVLFDNLFTIVYSSKISKFLENF